MRRRRIGWLLSGLSVLVLTAGCARSTAEPYATPAANRIDALLFSDNLQDFLARPGEAPAAWQRVLATNPPDLPGLRHLAGDPLQEGRVRYLAYQRLRAAGQPLPGQHLLGVIVEMPVQGGLDALAAYSDGGVRYVNHSGNIAVVEANATALPAVQGLFSAAQPLLASLSPSHKPRQAPPSGADIRLTLLSSKGPVVLQLSRSSLASQPQAAAVLLQASQLQLALTAATPR